MGVRYLIVLCAGLIVLSCGRTPQGNRENGARWYALHRCNACHGEEGRGGRAPALRPYQQVFWQLEKKVRKSGSTIMPSYNREQISDQDLADIHAYLTAR